MARPPAPVLRLGLPLTMRLPPVAVPAAAARPALSTMALLPVLVVATDAARLRSPLWVLTATGPVPPMPLVPSTLPMVKAPLLRTSRPATPLAASVPMLVPALSSSTLPPSSCSPLAETKPLPVSATVPLACRVTVLPVAVRPAASVRLPPCSRIGPAMVCAVFTLMSAVLPALPSVSPVMPATEKFAMGHDKALLKLVLNGCTVSVPVASTATLVLTVSASAVSVTLLLLAVTEVAAFLPSVPP